MQKGRCHSQNKKDGFGSNVLIAQKREKAVL